MTDLTPKPTQRLPRAIIACLVALVMLVVSVSAYSDTYNFYFTKPKKNGAPADQSPAEENEETPAAPPAPEAAKPTTTSNQVAVSPNGQQPIIINNNNNIQMPTAPAAVEPTPVTPTPSRAGETVATGVLVDPDYHYPWHFGLSAAYYNGRRSAYGSYTYYDEYSSNYDYTKLGDQWAGLISLGVDFTRLIGINAYASTIVSNRDDAKNFDIGGDFVVTPFRITVGKLPLVELGFLAGTSKGFIDDNRIGGVPAYVGSRFTLNLDRQFGITAAVRTNFNMAMAEAGIVTHF